MYANFYVTPRHLISFFSKTANCSVSHVLRRTEIFTHKRALDLNVKKWNATIQ